MIKTTNLLYWCLLLLVFGAACNDALSPPEKKEAENAGYKEDLVFPGCDLLLISLDTLRADRLSAYGYEKTDTPVIDSLVKRSILFTAAQTQAMVTAPSHITMMTSIHPWVHGVRNLSNSDDQDFTSLPPSIPTLAEILKQEGYKTAGFTGGGNLSPKLGFDRGFDIYTSRNNGISAKVDEAESFLQTLNEEDRFFLFLHTYEVHDYYRPKDFEGLFFKPEEGRALLEKKGAIQAYDRRIERCDEVLRRLFLKLIEMKRFKSMLVVFTSDHGESFYEHGHLGHYQFFSEVSQVPLIIHLPKDKLGGRRVDALVGLVDLMPTLLDLMAVEKPSILQGMSLLPMIKGEATALRPVFGERNDRKIAYSVSFGDYKLVDDPESIAPINNLYNRRDDPFDKHDLSKEHPRIMARLQAMATKHIKQCTELSKKFGSKIPLKIDDPELLDELKALGY